MTSKYRLTKATKQAIEKAQSYIDCCSAKRQPVASVELLKCVIEECGFAPCLMACIGTMLQFRQTAAPYHTYPEDAAWAERIANMFGMYFELVNNHVSIAPPFGGAYVVTAQAVARRLKASIEENAEFLRPYLGREIMQDNARLESAVKGDVYSALCRCAAYSDDLLACVTRFSMEELVSNQQLRHEYCMCHAALSGESYGRDVAMRYLIENQK